MRHIILSNENFIPQNELPYVSLIRGTKKWIKLGEGQTKYQGKSSLRQKTELTLSRLESVKCQMVIYT